MGVLDKVIAKGEEIYGLIPQKPPFVMVDNLLVWSSIRVKTSLFINENNILSYKGFFSEAGLIEAIAQTASLRVGMQCKIDNTPVPTGFIGAIKNLKIFFLPVINTEITTEIEATFEILNATVVLGRVFSGDALAAECEMKIFLVDNL